MRLIDADRLIDDLKHDVAIDQDSLDYEELTDSNREKIQFDKDCKQNAIDLLQNAPTIEPERKKGKWLHKSKQLAALNTAWWYECLICGYHAFNGMRTDFCPNCGADMRGEQDD